MARSTFRYPLQRDNNLGYFQMTSTTLDTLKQNLLLFVVTDEGERVVNNQIGSRFRRFLFEPKESNIRTKCENEINRIFSYFPDLVLVNFEVKFREDNELSQGVLDLNIVYSLKGVVS